MRNFDNDNDFNNIFRSFLKFGCAAIVVWGVVVIAAVWIIGSVLVHLFGG